MRRVALTSLLLLLCSCAAQSKTVTDSATLQRALKARLAYDGPITSVLDAPTRAAIRAFQAPQGFDSDELARVIAERIGIVPVARTTLTPDN